MNGNDVFAATISVLFILFLIFAGAFQFGARTENERLYLKCLSENSEMIYNKAIVHCKEHVK